MEIEKEVKEGLEGIVNKVIRRIETIGSVKMYKESEETKGDIDYRDSETITIIAPNDYYKRYKICDPLKGENMISFKDKDKYLREENLSLREVTLRMIPVLTIVDKKDENEKEILHLNLGFNPYCKYNDYYISELNNYTLEWPLIIFKRKIDFKVEKIERPRMTLMKGIRRMVSGIKQEEEGGGEIEDEKNPIMIIARYKDLNESGRELIKDRKDVIIIKGENENDSEIRIGKYDNTHDDDGDYWQDNYKEKGDRSIFEDRENMSIDNLDFGYDNEYNSINMPNNYVWMYGEMNYPPEKEAYEWLKKKNGDKEFELVLNSLDIYEGCIEDLRNNFESIETDKSRDFTNIDKFKYSIDYEKSYSGIIDKLKIISGTSLCSDIMYSKITAGKEPPGMDGYGEEYFKKSSLKLALDNYAINMLRYIKKGDDFNLRKYFMAKDNIFDTFYLYERIYQDVMNRKEFFKLLEDELKNYKEQCLENDACELSTPDIYILLGYHEFPSNYTREFWNLYDFSNEYKWRLIINSLSFLESTGWYYIYGLCCFFAQVIGPSYYVYNYYLIDKNEYCPNNSSILNKFFAVTYYLVLYARMNSFWSSLTNTVWQYGNSSIITSPNYLRLTMIINSICLCIIPLFTYTLFIELSNVTDLILNCLTGEFLINIDNLVIEFIGEEDYIKGLTKDLMLFSFIDRGYPRKNILDPTTGSIDLFLLSAFQAVQMFGTLFITVFVYKCI